MPNPAPASEPRRHTPPRGLLRAVLVLLSTAPAAEVLAVATGTPAIASFAARAAHAALLATIAPALVLAADVWSKPAPRAYRHPGAVHSDAPPTPLTPNLTGGDL